MGRFVCQLNINNYTDEFNLDTLFFNDEFFQERLEGKEKYFVQDENIKLVMYKKYYKPFHFKENFRIFGNIWIKERIDLEDRLVKYDVSILEIKEDLEFLKVAYEYLGIDFLNYLDGEYNLVIEDGEYIYLINDCFSTTNMFFAYDGRQVLVSNFLESFREYASEDNPQFYKDFFENKGYILTDSTPYKNVNRVPAGKYMKLNISTRVITEHEYWNLDSIKINYSITMDEAKNKFIKLLTKSIMNCCEKFDTIGIALSGGLDSTTIACLVKRQNVAAISSVFDKYNEDDERKYLMETCNKNNIKSILVNTDYLTSFYNFPNDSPITQVPYCNVATYGAQKIIYETAKREGIDIVLTGLGGDEVLSGTNYFNHDLFFSGHILKALRNIGNLSRNRQEPLIYNIKKYILSPLKSKNKYSYGRKKEIRRIKENLLQLLTEYISDVDNIIIRHPYLDRKLIEFMLSLPIQFKISKAGHKKYLLRIAMKEIIPDSILNRLDKTSHFGIIYGGLKKEWSKLSKILNNDNYLEFKRKYGLDNSNLDDINFDLWAMGRDGNELAWPLVSMMIWEYKVGKKYDKFTKYK